MTAAAVSRAWRVPWVRIALGLLGFAAVTLVTSLMAHPRIFSGFAVYDDEGYMLIALRSFINHGHLYDDVFSQYGPFYYELWGGVFQIFGIPVNHDGGRDVTMVTWILASLLCGLAGWRMTRSALLGLAVQILTFDGIFTLVNEPMHPGGIICLLLGTILAISCFVGARSSPFAMAVLGAAVTALILVKINVGVFALLSLALACVVSYPVLRERRWLRPAIEALFVVVPFLVMSSKLGDAWARQYAIHVAVAALAVVLVLRSRREGERWREELVWLVGGLAVMALVVCGAIIAAGTSPAGLFEGVISQPLRQSAAFTFPLKLSSRVYLFDVLALVGVLAYRHTERGDRAGGASPGFTTVVSLLSILIGISMALSVVGRTALFDLTTFNGYQFALLPFCWVALIPVAGSEDRSTAFARLLLPLLAVLQSLHAFPVAGSQSQWAVFLIVGVGALCVANGARGLIAVPVGGRERRAVAAIGVAAGAAVAIALVNVQLREPLRAFRAGFHAAVPLGLSGAEQVRLSPEEDATFRQVTRAIDRNCTDLVMLPGMNSFYLWARREPPTGFNATDWMTLFDDAHQQRIIDATRSTRGLCLLENPTLLELWTGNEPTEGPLVPYLRRGFRPLVTIGDYRLLRRERVAS